MKFLSKTLLLILFLFQTAQAIEVIDILGGKANELAVAVIPFSGDDADNEKNQIHNIIKSDLSRSGFFRIIKTEGVKSLPANSDQVDYTFWSGLKTELMVIGRVEKNEQQIKVTYDLVDVFKEKLIISTEYMGTLKQARQIGHQISNVIYEKITGTPGVFHTKIGYVQKVNNKKFHLNVADMDGFNAKSVVISNEPIISTRWSPDGEKIAYVSFEKKKPVIFVQNLKTGDRKLVANFKGNNSSPAWSPDSKKLAIVLTYSANSQLYIINEDGSDIRQLMRTYSINTEPAWAPNGDEIYFVSDRGGNGQIYKVNINNNEVTRVTYEGKNNLSPSISPDGKLLLFISQKDGKYRVALQNLLNNQYLTLTEGPQDESPLFAPNGHMVLFTYKDYGKITKIGTVSINGLMKTPIDLGKGIVLESTWGPLKN